MNMALSEFKSRSVCVCMPAYTICKLQTCMHMFMCIVDMYIRITCIYIHMCIYIHICIYICTYLYIYIHTEYNKRCSYLSSWLRGAAQARSVAPCLGFGLLLLRCCLCLFKTRGFGCGCQALRTTTAGNL